MNEVKDSVEFYRNLWAGAEARLADSQAEVNRLTAYSTALEILNDESQAEVAAIKFDLHEKHREADYERKRAADAEAEVARLRADAGRYCWLRDHGRTPDHEFDELSWNDARDALSWTKDAGVIDAAIDRAMKAARTLLEQTE